MINKYCFMAVAMVLSGCNLMGNKDALVSSGLSKDESSNHGEKGDRGEKGEKGDKGDPQQGALSLTSVIRCTSYQGDGTTFQRYLEYSISKYSDGSSHVACSYEPNGSTYRNTQFHTAQGSISSQDQCAAAMKGNGYGMIETISFQNISGSKSVTLSGSYPSLAYTYTFSSAECIQE